MRASTNRPSPTREPSQRLLGFQKTLSASPPPVNNHGMACIHKAHENTHRSGGAKEICLRNINISHIRAGYEKGRTRLEKVASQRQHNQYTHIKPGVYRCQKSSKASKTRLLARRAAASALLLCPPSTCRKTRQFRRGYHCQVGQDREIKNFPSNFRLRIRTSPFSRTPKKCAPVDEPQIAKPLPKSEGRFSYPSLRRRPYNTRKQTLH